MASWMDGPRLLVRKTRHCSSWGWECRGDCGCHRRAARVVARRVEGARATGIVQWRSGDGGESPPRAGGVLCGGRPEVDAWQEEHEGWHLGLRNAADEAGRRNTKQYSAIKI